MLAAILVPVFVVGLAVLALLGLRLWRQVRALSARVRAAGTTMTDALAELPAVGTDPGAQRPTGPTGRS